ncbi:UDP-N-acetylmuramoyl-L-alanine--D-glutamate ligase [Patescibacteria group bacterium]
MSTRTHTLKGKKVLILGLGLHGGGVGVAQWLVKQGAKVTVTDLRRASQLRQSLQKLKGLEITFVLGGHRKSDILHADLIVKNPGVPLSSPFLLYAKKRGILVTSDISLFLERCKSTIVGITGTKGKTTTATLIASIFKKKWKGTVLAGNTRATPLLSLDKLKTTDPVVLELSSWQLQDMRHLKISPHISVMTNFFPDHLDRHSSLGDYLKAKKTIFMFQKKGDYSILNYENAVTKKLASSTISRTVMFSKKPISSDNCVFIKNGVIIYRKNKKNSKILSIKEMSLPGKHNAENILAAVAVACIAQVPLVSIKKALTSFKGLPGRMEKIAVKKGVTYINDTTATTPNAAIAALNTHKKAIILIAGGADKKLPLSEFIRKIGQSVSLLVLLPGKATNRMISKLRNQGVHFVLAGTMDEAVKVASQNASSGDTVLLSPGCSSFGIFIHEFDRGDKFNKAVRNL